MTNITKISVVALALAAYAAPAAALAPLRQATINSTVVGSIVRLAPRDDTLAGNHDNLSTSNPYAYFNWDHSSYAQGYDNDSAAHASGTLAISNSYIKATLGGDARVSSTIPIVELASASSSMSALNIDKLTFSGFGRSNTAVVKITRFAEVSLTSTTDGNSAFAKGSNFSYSSDLTLYNNVADITSETASPKFNSSFRVCDTIAVCSGNRYLKNGFRYTTTFFQVDSDDVLFVTNKLDIGSSVAAYRTSANYAYGAISQDNDFGHSGYTAIELLTPGVSYLSANGEAYITSIAGAVPEPGSWAMLIAGFGLTGAAMRRRRQGGRAVAA